MQSKITKLHCFLVVLLAFLLYPVFYGVHIAEGADTYDYVEAARIIVNGYHQITFRVPVYPLLLIVTHSVDHLSTSLFIIQYLLYFISIVSLVLAMLHSSIDKRQILLVTILLVSPLLVPMVYQAMTESIAFSLVNFVFSGYILIKSKFKFLLLGLVLAILTLTRPSFQLTGLLLTILFFVTEKNKFTSILFFFAFAIPVFLFSFFNKAKFDFFGITPATGWHLTTKTALFIEEWPDKKMRPLLIRQRNENLVNRSSHTGSMFVWNLPYLLQDSLQLNYVQLSKYMMKNNVALIKSHPLEYLSAVGRSLVDYTFPNAISVKVTGVKKGMYAITQFFYVYLSLLVMVASFVCLWLFRGRINKKWSFPLMLAAIVIFSNYFASIAAEVGSSRHRMPTEGLILMSIVYALPIISSCRRAVIFGSSHIFK